MASFAERMLDELSSGRLEEAQKSFASSLRYDDDDMVYSLAEELYALGFTKQSERAYKKLLEKYPDEDQVRTALADIAIDNDETDEALTYLAAITPESTAYLESLLVMADLYQSEGLLEAAEVKLQEAYQLAPSEPVIRFALAEYYYTVGRYQESIPFYRDLLKAGDRHFSGVDIAARIGVAYALVGNNENALGYLEQIKETDLTPDVRFQLAMLYAADEDKIEQAIKAFDALQELDSSYAGIYEPLAKLYETQGNLDQALITYQTGISVDPFNVTLIAKAAKIAESKNDIALATKLYQDGLMNNPDDMTLVIGYSNLLVEMGDYIININMINDLLDRDDSKFDAQLYWNLAQSYTALEDYAMATKFWNAAMPFYIENSDFLKPAYYYFREEGEQNLANQALENYVKLVPEDYEMLELYDQLKNKNLF